MNFEISPEEKRELLRIARKALEKPGWKPTLEEFEPGLLSEPHACFVTLLNSDDSLRGCIGTLADDTPLGVAAAKYAHLAATQDPRFAPVRPFEVKELCIEMSVLGPHEPLPSLGALELGRHGLYVQSGAHRGVLLAKVAVEYGWNREEFLRQTCIKAGLNPALSDTYDVRYFEEVSFGEKGD